jgi:uncharacterized protein (TIRG00374 family)
MIPDDDAPMGSDSTVKLVLKFLLSLLVGAVCIWFALKKIDLRATVRVLGEIPYTAVALYVVVLAISHFFRAWRWHNLLRPMGVSLPGGRLLAISSVGFMAILALPVRLGEFVRPYYVVRTGQSRMSAVLGTVAVERIVDGLVIAILFFTCYLVAPAGAYPAALAVAAWVSLLGFVVLTVFLACALAWPERTVRLVLTLTLIAHLAPSLGQRLADKLRALIHGFGVLRQPRDLIPFLGQTILYWGINGMGMWLLARAMHLDISPMAAYAAMAFTGVVISLPNAPGLVGQFHAGILWALAAYLPAETISSTGGAYAVAVHGIQMVWYLAVGFLSLFFVGGRATSLREVVIESNRAAAEGGSGAQ